MTCPACADARDVTLLDGSKVLCGLCHDPMRVRNPLTQDLYLVVEDQRHWQIQHAHASDRWPELDEPAVMRQGRDHPWIEYPTLRDALRAIGHHAE